MANGSLSLVDVQRQISQSGATWIAGDNPIWRLSDTEQRLRLGVVEPANAREFSGHVHHHPGAGLPTKLDYRDLNGRNYVTAVRDQGQCGSCVAFGSIAAVEATISRAKNNSDPTIDLSEAQMFFCYGGQDGATCASGWWPDKALPHCVHPGVVDEECFRYTPQDQPCELCSDSSSRLRTISSFSKVGSQAAIRDWLVSRGAVVVAFDVYTDFFSYKSGVYQHVTGQRAGGHCVALIGYDDQQQCWICKNSWNTGWGERGFFRIGYGQCRIDSWDVLGVE